MKALSQNSLELGGLAPDFGRSEAVFHVDTLIIVKLDIFSYSLLHFGTAGKIHTVQAFRLQRTKEVFRSGIVIRASGTGHRRLKMVFLTQVKVCL